jgi:chromate reductase
MNNQQSRHRIAIIVGSIREGSLNRKLAQAICGSVPHSLDCQMLTIHDLPLYDPDLDRDPPAPYTRFRQELAACDGVLFVTPEYNRGVPAALKNAIDVGSRPYGKSAWAKKPEAYIGGISDEKFGPDGAITDESLAKLIGTIGEAFAAWVQLIHAGRAALQPDPSGSGA